MQGFSCYFCSQVTAWVLLCYKLIIISWAVVNNAELIVDGLLSISPSIICLSIDNYIFYFFAKTTGQILDGNVPDHFLNLINVYFLHNIFFGGWEKNLLQNQLIWCCHHFLISFSSFVEIIFLWNCLTNCFEIQEEVILGLPDINLFTGWHSYFIAVDMKQHVNMDCSHSSLLCVNGGGNGMW